MKIPAIIVDIDQTIADLSHRLHLILQPKGEKKWDEFYSLLDKDVAIPDMCILVDILSRHYETLYVTGRPERKRKDTEFWLFDKVLPSRNVFMRPDDDRRNDAEVKRDLYFKYIEPKYDVTFVFEDRTCVVKMWRSLGLRTLQVCDGDY